MPDEARGIRRPAATFKRRRRKLSPKRQAEFEEWIDRWGLDAEGPPLDLPAIFGRSAPVYLDVGFGHGESTIELARVRPEVDVIGVEVHDPGVVTVLDATEHVPLPNVRVVHGDVLPFLDRVRSGALAGICVFFPDPWPKPRQQHRRLIRSDVVAAFVDRLVPGGELLLATDVADYAAQMVEACDADGRLEGGSVDQPAWRPATRFERRGRDEGRPATDLRYRRR